MSYLVEHDGVLYVTRRHPHRGCTRGVPIRATHIHQTLCEAAMVALDGREVAIPGEAQLLGYIDREGRVRIESARFRDAECAWAARLDRHQLENVADERERDERQRFRRAVMGNRAEMARLGPRRGWRW